MKLKKTLITALVMALTYTPLVFAKTTQEKLADINKILEAEGNASIVDALHDSLALYVEQQHAFDKTLKENHDYIFNNPDLPWFGAEKPILTIAVLTDLSCPWCKKLDPVMRKIVEKHPDEIRVVNLYIPLKERGMASNSATFALNVWQKDKEKFEDIELTMMSKPGIHNIRSIMKVAEAKNAMEHVSTTDKATEIVEKNRELFSKLGAHGTPAILLNDSLIPGYMPYERMYPAVLEALEKKRAELSNKE